MTPTRAPDAGPSAAGAAWPALPLAQWQDTHDTLHRWTQIVGKTRLRLAPPVNHWWHAALYVGSRGLGTSPIPCGSHTFEVDFDFLDHVLRVRKSNGTTRTLALAPMSVAEFYREYMRLFRELDMRVQIHPGPNEIVDATPFPEDHVHASYDADAVTRFWRALARADRLLKEFRGSFVGKCSPVHFWWGSFDLSCTRFSGRPAPPHPGGIPNLPDYVTREAYSHECISAGWWPGGGEVPGPAFYAYVYPQPEGCAAAPVRPAAARFDGGLQEWILPEDGVRAVAEPDQAVHEFLNSTYVAAAELSGWPRAALERAPTAP